MKEEIRYLQYLKQTFLLFITFSFNNLPSIFGFFIFLLFQNLLRFLFFFSFVFEPKVFL